MTAARVGKSRADAAPLLTAARWILLAIPVVVALACTSPRVWFAARPLTVSYFEVPKLFAFSVLLGAALSLWGLALLRGETQLRVPGVVGWLVLAFLGTGLVSSVTGLHVPTAFFGDISLQGFVVWLGYVLLWFLVIQLVSGRGVATRAAVTVVASASVVAAYDVVQLVFLNPKAWPGLDPWMATRGTSTIGNPDPLGGYLVLPLVLAAALALGRSDWREKAALWTGFVIMNAALMISQTRGAVLGAMLGLGILGSAAWRAGPGLRRSLMRLAAAVAAASAGAVLVVGVGDAIQRVRELANATGDVGGRMIIWREALRVIGRYPFFGVGPDSYRLAWYGARSPDLIPEGGIGITVTEPHNLLLTLAATFGIAAAVVATMVLVVTLWQVRSAVADREFDPAKFTYAGWWAGTCGLVCYCLFGTTPIPITLMLWFALGMLGAPIARKAMIPSRSPCAVIGTFAVALALVFALIGVRTFLADVAKIDSKEAGADSVAVARSVVKLTPWSTGARRWLAVAYAAQATGAAQAQNMTAADQWADRAVTEYENAAAFSPSDLDVYGEYAEFLYRLAAVGAGRFEDVAAVAERGLEVDRYALNVAMIGASALEKLGQFSRLVGMLDDIWDLDPNSPDPGVLYAWALTQLGRPADAIGILDALEQRFPGNEYVLELRSHITSAAPTSQ